MRDSRVAVAVALNELAAAHARRGDAHYYEVRDRRFNPLRRERRREDGQIEYTPELAGMLLYLNRTGFNGLFRVNASGGFNVPPADTTGRRSSIAASCDAWRRRSRSLASP